MRLYLILISFSVGVLSIKPLTDSSLFEDVEGSDINLFEGDLGHDSTRPPIAGFHDETDPLSMDDEDLFLPDLSLTTAFPHDGSAFIPDETFDPSIPSLYPESKSSSPIAEDTSCSSTNNQMPVKRQAGEACSTDSINHPAPNQPIQVDRATYPEFYGIPIQGYTLEKPSSDDDASECGWDVVGLPKFLVCDSGISSDRILHFSRKKFIGIGYTLKNCVRGMFLIF